MIPLIVTIWFTLSFTFIVSKSFLFMQNDIVKVDRDYHNYYTTATTTTTTTTATTTTTTTTTTAAASTNSLYERTVVVILWAPSPGGAWLLG